MGKMSCDNRGRHCSIIHYIACSNASTSQGMPRIAGNPQKREGDKEVSSPWGFRETIVCWKLDLELQNCEAIHFYCFNPHFVSILENEYTHQCLTVFLESIISFERSNCLFKSENPTTIHFFQPSEWSLVNSRDTFPEMHFQFQSWWRWLIKLSKVTWSLGGERSFFSNKILWKQKFKWKPFLTLLFFFILIISQWKATKGGWL